MLWFFEKKINKRLVWAVLGWAAIWAATMVKDKQWKTLFDKTKNLLADGLEQMKKDMARIKKDQSNI